MLPSSTPQTNQVQSRRYRRRTVPQERRRPTEITAKNNTNTNTNNDDGAKEGPSAKRKRQSHSFGVTRLEPLFIPLQLDKVWIVKTATSVLVDHLLFTRGLFPITVAELLTQKNNEGNSALMTTEAPSTSFSSSSTRRKLRQAQNQWQQFTQAWTSSKSSSFIRRASYILITLGPSFGRGRESYLVEIRELASSSKRHLKPLPPSAVLARRLLPRVMESDASAELPSSAASLRLFVSLWLQKDELEGYWREVNEGSSADDSRTFGTTSTSWIPRTGRVLPKTAELHSLSVSKRPKKRLVSMALKPKTEASTSSTVMETHESDDDILSLGGVESDGQWFTLPQVIKGFRM